MKILENPQNYSIKTILKFLKKETSSYRFKKIDSDSFLVISKHSKSVVITKEDNKIILEQRANKKNYYWISLLICSVIYASLKVFKNVQTSYINAVLFTASIPMLNQLLIVTFNKNTENTHVAIAVATLLIKKEYEESSS